MRAIATYTFGQALLTVLEFALLFFWIWIGIRVIIDVFASHDLSNWAKAGWILLIVLVPLLGVVIYMIVRGDKMGAHEVSDYADQQDAASRRQHGAGAASLADDIAKLEDLKSRGILTDGEFQRAKQRALA